MEGKDQTTESERDSTGKGREGGGGEGKGPLLEITTQGTQAAKQEERD